MGKVTATSFITLDNVVEEPQLWSGAFQSDDTGELNLDALRAHDAMLLGRVTYEGFAAAWPSRSGDEYSDTFNSMPKYVVSRTIEHADWNNSTIIADDVAGQIRGLKKEHNLLVWGSPTLVQSLIDDDLVDEYVLLVSRPSFAGKAPPMRPPLSAPVDGSPADAGERRASSGCTRPSGPARPETRSST